MGKTKVVIIGGCGHVGLPLGIVLATFDDLSVDLLDIDHEKIALINQGQLPFIEEGMEPLLKQVCGKSLKATADTNCLREADIAITVIGTPVDNHLNPLLKEIHEHTDKTIDLLPDGALLILRSTLYPGVSKLVYDRIKSKRDKIYLAVCPERIAQGKALEELKSLPQIVGAFDEESMKRASRLFARLAPSIIELSPLEAELGKLFVNSWRYLNFAVSNQFYILCQRYGLDFYRIYDAFKYGYPRMSSAPQAGFTAGPCLLKDTLQLCAYSNNLFFMGNVAMVVNESLPNFIIEQLQGLELSSKKVAILGMTFKQNLDDTRDSLAFKLKNLLSVYAKEVYCTDPYAKDSAFVSLEQAIAKADVIILGAPHAVYADLKFPEEKIVIDIWGFWPRKNPIKVIEGAALEATLKH